MHQALTLHAHCLRDRLKELVVSSVPSPANSNSYLQKKNPKSRMKSTGYLIFFPSQSKILLVQYSLPHNCSHWIICNNMITDTVHDKNKSPFMFDVDRAKKNQKKKTWMNRGGKILKGRTADSRQSTQNDQSTQNYTAAYSRLQWMDLW